MQTTTTNMLSCSVYGHNLERSTNPSKAADKLVCKTCSAEISISTNGEFNAHPVKNKRLISALKEYIVLKNRRLHQQLSY